MYVISNLLVKPVADFLIWQVRFIQTVFFFLHVSIIVLILLPLSRLVLDAPLFSLVFSISFFSALGSLFFGFDTLSEAFWATP